MKSVIVRDKLLLKRAICSLGSMHASFMEREVLEERKGESNSLNGKERLKTLLPYHEDVITSPANHLSSKKIPCPLGECGYSELAKRLRPNA